MSTRVQEIRAARQYLKDIGYITKDRPMLWLEGDQLLGIARQQHSERKFNGTTTEADITYTMMGAPPPPTSKPVVRKRGGTQHSRKTRKSRKSRNPRKRGRRAKRTRRTRKRGGMDEMTDSIDNVSVASLPILPIPTPPRTQRQLDRALMNAIYDESLAGVRKEIEDGANVNYQEVEDGGNETQYISTPLHRAAQRDNVDIVKILLKRGAHVNALDQDDDFGEGLTPLHWATRYGNPDIVNVLIDAGANVNAHTGDGGTTGVTPLWEASGYAFMNDFYRRPRHRESDRVAIAQLLLEKGADPNIAVDRVRAGRIHHDNTPLSHAVRSDFVDLARMLLERGANPNLTDSTKTSPLVYAVDNANTDMLRLLFKHGADPNLHVGLDTQIRPDPWSPLFLVEFYTEPSNDTKYDPARTSVRTGPGRTDHVIWGRFTKEERKNKVAEIRDILLRNGARLHPSQQQQGDDTYAHVEEERERIKQEQKTGHLAVARKTNDDVAGVVTSFLGPGRKGGRRSKTRVARGRQRNTRKRANRR